MQAVVGQIVLRLHEDLEFSVAQSAGHAVFQLVLLEEDRLQAGVVQGIARAVAVVGHAAFRGLGAQQAIGHIAVIRHGGGHPAGKEHGRAELLPQGGGAVEKGLYALPQFRHVPALPERG